MSIIFNTKDLLEAALNDKLKENGYNDQETDDYNLYNIPGYIGFSEMIEKPYIQTAPFNTEDDPKLKALQAKYTIPRVDKHLKEYEQFNNRGEGLSVSDSSNIINLIMGLGGAISGIYGANKINKSRPVIANVPKDIEPTLIKSNIAPLRSSMEESINRSTNSYKDSLIRLGNINALGVLYGKDAEQKQNMDAKLIEYNNAINSKNAELINQAKAQNLQKDINVGIANAELINKFNSEKSQRLSQNATGIYNSLNNMVSNIFNNTYKNDMMLRGDIINEITYYKEKLDLTTDNNKRNEYQEIIDNLYKKLEEHSKRYKSKIL